MKHSPQLDLIDTTPLQLWDRESVPIQLDSGIVYWTPGHQVLTESAEARQCREAKTREENAGHCLRCDRLLKPDRKMFCSGKCRAAWIAQRDRDVAKLTRTRLAEGQGAETELF